jgi:hypothetical protein
MKIYTIAITETLIKLIDVEAESETEAIDRVKKLYRNQEIILDAEDHIDTEITIY